MAGLPIPILPPVDEPAQLNNNPILYWNSVALDLNRVTVTFGGPAGGPLSGPPGAFRALGILHLAIHDAYFGLKPRDGIKTFLKPGQLPNATRADQPAQAVAGAAYTVLFALYASASPVVGTNLTLTLRQFVQQAADKFRVTDSAGKLTGLDALSKSYQFGVMVGKAILGILEIKPEDQALQQGDYRPQPGPFKFDDDPTNPVRLLPINPNDPTGPQRAVRIYHAPFYGLLAKRLAVQHSVKGPNNQPKKVFHVIADPPIGFGTNDLQEYASATTDVITKGGAPDQRTTTRTSAEQVTAFTWAYDGSTLIGTPPRAYNLILRLIAWSHRLNTDLTLTSSDANNADFARLFALANVSAADAGIFAWQEKYRFDFWRPLSGIRESGHPFFLTLGAPHTNSNDIPFKPPFPSYPSGHATFGGAFFQAARLHFKGTRGFGYEDDAPDGIAFDWTSEELNGVSRDLRQPYDPARPITEQVGTVRTKVPRKYNSLWEAMFENAISRVYLGVHWPFDAFSSKDVSIGWKALDGSSVYKAAADIRYKTEGTRRDTPGMTFPVGGVPLGIEIANDVFQGGLQQTPEMFQPSGLNKAGDFVGPVDDVQAGVVNVQEEKGGKLEAQQVLASTLEALDGEVGKGGVAAGFAQGVDGGLGHTVAPITNGVH